MYVMISSVSNPSVSFIYGYTWNSEKDLCLRSTAIPSSPLWEGLDARYTLFYRSDFHPFHECLLLKLRFSQWNRMEEKKQLYSLNNIVS